MKQGVALSPTLFGIYINNLAKEIKSLKCGVVCGMDNANGKFLYADDIVLLL